ncbi:hypothetical protein [Amycolatopsis vastitatis]|uniref:Uncharacterized protein n=1 Tax=Amycolatopsis vastitatis TaxID=1905142 RepID=A0A229SS43_9PSEU|nr:hypothetical protein [Amycolatopsis vastitatis]OXM61389.1 hypothetical protein CF165_38605 [Amycolatopsis vastitatis]
MTALVMCFELKRPVDESLRIALERWLEVARTVPGFVRFSFDASDTEAIATLVVDDPAVVDAINVAVGTTTWVDDNVGPYLARLPHVVQGEPIVESAAIG